MSCIEIVENVTTYFLIPSVKADSLSSWTRVHHKEGSSS